MADSTTSRHSRQLKSQAHEYTKQYLVYDAQGRAIEIYTAHADTGNGGKCSLVQYTYTTATASTVEKMKESTATWDSAWDI